MDGTELGKWPLPTEEAAFVGCQEVIGIHSIHRQIGIAESVTQKRSRSPLPCPDGYRSG